MKVSELEGFELDAWVAKADGKEVVFFEGSGYLTIKIDGKTIDGREYCPSVDWAQGGPIIEREKIGTNTWTGDWCAQFTLPVRHPTNPKRDPSHHCMRGETPLIAAMRTYVASRFGDEVSEE